MDQERHRGTLVYESMFDRSRAWLSLLVPVVGAAACGVAFEPPEVRFEGMRLGGVGLRGGTIHAQLYVGNPNGFDLEASSLTYDLEVRNGESSGDNGWKRLADGTFDETIRVGAGESKVVEVPIEFEYADLGGALYAIMDHGTFDYRVTGVAKLRRPIGRAVPYRHSGRVSMAGAR